MNIIMNVFFFFFFFMRRIIRMRWIIRWMRIKYSSSSSNELHPLGCSSRIRNSLFISCRYLLWYRWIYLFFSIPQWNCSHSHSSSRFWFYLLWMERCLYWNWSMYGEYDTSTDRWCYIRFIMSKLL